jgi:hypothetical protein
MESTQSNNALLCCQLCIAFVCLKQIPVQPTVLSCSPTAMCCAGQSCTTPSGAGTCRVTTDCSKAGGKSVPGYCPGATNYQCCVPSTPPPAGVHQHHSLNLVTSVCMKCMACADMCCFLPNELFIFAKQEKAKDLFA